MALGNISWHLTQPEAQKLTKLAVALGNISWHLTQPEAQKLTKLAEAQSSSSPGLLMHPAL